LRTCPLSEAMQLAGHAPWRHFTVIPTRVSAVVIAIRHEVGTQLPRSIDLGRATALWMHCNSEE